MMITNFKLRKKKDMKFAELEHLDPDVVHMLETMLDKNRTGQKSNTSTEPDRLIIGAFDGSNIRLDDVDFGKY